MLRQFARVRLTSVSDERPEGQPLALDAKAESFDPALPAFLARPEGAPVYHGFPVLADVVIDGFTLGLISDSFSSPSEWGDAFVIAPDGRRAGLVWEAAGEPYFNTLIGAEVGRWGVFGVGTEHAPTSKREALLFLAELVPRLREAWEKSVAEP